MLENDTFNCIIAAIMWFAFPLYLLTYNRFHGGGTIDSSVNNRIIAHDGNGRYLVEAKTSRQITGPRPHVTDNLPASLYKVKKGLWIVDSSGGTPPPTDKINWEPVKGYSINPRGNTETGGFLSDEMEGWEHNYIRKDD